jgi:hypothetical protein
MTSTQAIAFLQEVRRSYITRKMLSYGLQSLGIGVLTGAIAGRWLGASGLTWLIGILTALLTFIAFLFKKPLLRTSLPEVALHLDRTRPELEQSCVLLFKPEAELSLLEQFQRQRMLTALSSMASPSNPFVSVSFRKAWLVPLLCVFGALAFSFIPETQSEKGRGRSATPPAITSIARSLPQIKEVRIEVIPPAYTRKPAYFSPSPQLRVEEGAQVNWTITTTQATDSLKWVLNDQAYLLKPERNSSNVFNWQQTLSQAGFYYLEIAGKKSDYYAIEIIPDKAPEIAVSSPELYTDVDFGDPLHVTLKAAITDDYGVRNAQLIATVAKGSGEAVKFREEKIPLNINFQAQKISYAIEQRLNLWKLGMEWGDELYFYLQAWDNHHGYTRSETYFVQMEDTSQVEASFDMTMGVNPMPEYFRSQRQIIIDTEKLLQEKAGIPAADFQTRSNNLGIDQRVLRLRYGKFLGEEAESGRGDIAGKEELEEGHDELDGHDHGHSNQSESPTTFGTNTEAMLEPYSHRHDSEEGATFLEPAVKTKLKACLAQMWEAELRLRTHQPKAALPFEYKALKLLKEVQQSSRAYVQKTGFDPPPIKPQEKRLTGDLSKVQQVKNQRRLEKETAFPGIRQAMGWLASKARSGHYQQSDAGMLEKAGQELAQEALRHPGLYLEALRDLRKLTGQVNNQEPLCRECLTTVEKAFWQLLPEAKPSPVPDKLVKNPLSDAYFKKVSEN